MRIVELCTDRLPCPPPKGGAIETYVYGISRAMKKLGAEVHLVTIGKIINVDYGGVIVHSIDLSTRVAAKLRKLLLPVNSLNKNIPYLTAKLLELFNKIEGRYGEVDVIHNHYFTTSFAPLIYKTFKRKDTLIVGHIHNEPKRNSVNRMLIETYDAHLAVSKYVRERTIELLGVDPNRVGVVYNAIDTEFFKPCKPSEKMERREIFEVSEDDFIIVFVGRIVPEKGLHHMLLASKILKQRGYKFKLLVAGPLGHFDTEMLNGYPKLCLSLINRLDLSNTIKYVGKLGRNGLRDLYCISDLVVVPSIWEDPCPTVVLEAMAMGRPVVAYSSGGIPELIPPYGGILINEKNPRLLAEEVEMVIQGSLTFNEFAAVEWVRERFSYLAVARRLLTIFKKMQN